MLVGESVVLYVMILLEKLYITERMVTIVGHVMLGTRKVFMRNICGSRISCGVATSKIDDEE